MRVHIVTEGNRIKRHISEKVIKYNTEDVSYSLSLSPRHDVDINFYNCFNVYMAHGKSNIKDTAYVTHIHNNNIQEHARDNGAPFDSLNQLDMVFHKSHRTVKQLQDAGYCLDNPNKVVYCGVEHEMFKPTITLGIIQNGEVEGKGTKFMWELVDSYDFTNFKFIFVGVGWEDVIQIMKDKGVRYEYIQDLEYSKFQSVYERMDYLFIPSLWEGGPMAPLEAMWCGLPMISSDVGWMKEIAPNSYIFEPGDDEKLKSILEAVEKKDIITYDNMERYTCEAFSSRLYEGFKELLGR